MKCMVKRNVFIIRELTIKVGDVLFVKKIKEENKLTISNRISKTSEYDDSVIYKAQSSCHCCDMDIIMEIEEDLNELEISFHKKIGISSEYDLNWFKEVWNQIKLGFKVLFTGYSEMIGSFYFQDEEQINDFVEALSEGMRKLKNKQMINESKNDE